MEINIKDVFCEFNDSITIPQDMKEIHYEFLIACNISVNKNNITLGSEELKIVTNMRRYKKYKE